jgi:hypothetical protein
MGKVGREALFWRLHEVLQTEHVETWTGRLVVVTAGDIRIGPEPKL